MRNIILPGMLAPNEIEKTENVYIENNKIYSKVVGLYDDEKKTIIQLEGNWIPKIDESVVGIITSSKGNVYEVELFFFGRGLLISNKYDNIRFNVGDVISASVKDVEDYKTVILWNPKALRGGTIIQVKATKVPRIVGRSNTMVEQIAQLTACNIVVGTNGIIWLRGDAISVATEAIRKIENEAHTTGLTERIKVMLEEEMLKLNSIKQ
ncbi:MAG: hypothetical protein M1538_03830 [Candidatus Marsarchaeota archaeon]|jgi:exosome complex component RRP4|nr:hypothetical protein [Candidatus Marsarchaeota archaeon]